MLKSVICGVGSRGLEHAQAIQSIEGIGLNGIFDLSAKACKEAERVTSVPGYRQVDRLLKEIEPDVVVITTPPQVRFSLIEQIVQSNGIRVIVVEKPLALSMQEARKIVSLCQQQSITLFTVHQLRFCQEFVRLKAAIDAGEIGHVQSLHAYCYGNLFNQGSHMIDAVRWLMGDNPVKWVISSSCNDLPILGRCSGISPDFVEDTSHPSPLWLNATLGFEGGIQAALYSGVLTQATAPSLGDWLQKRILAVGTEGMAEAHVASHFKLLSSRTGDWQVEKSDLASYLQATVQFYQAVVETIRGERAPFQKPEDVLRSLEVGLACMESVAEGNLVTLPLPKKTNPLMHWQKGKKAVAPGKQTSSSRNVEELPIVSIILPMDDHRGLGIRAVESWTDKQRCNPEDFELIVIIDENTKELEESLRQLLRPQDELIHQKATNEMEQYDLGARRSKGQYLFFTEPHCVAEPEAISEIKLYFETQSLDGFCIRSTPICSNSISRMESKMYDDGFKEWSLPDNWTKVILRGFGIHRDVYLEVGGYNFRYSRFSEWLFAAELRVKGYRLGYAPGVGVGHLYSDTFSLLDFFIKEFTDGECQFRMEGDRQFCERFFGSPAEWNEARSFDPHLAKSILRILCKQIFRPKGVSKSASGWSECLKQFLCFFPFASLGVSMLPIKYRVRVWQARMRFFLWKHNKEKRYLAFLDWYMRTTSFYRVKFALENPDPKSKSHSPCLSYPIDEIKDQDIFGFHAPERYEDKGFRWSSSVAAIRICLKPGDYGVTLQVNSARPLVPENELSLYLNHSPLKFESFNQQQGYLKFSFPKKIITPSKDQWLLFLCKPWSINGSRVNDERALGLPLVSIEL